MALTYTSEAHRPARFVTYGSQLEASIPPCSPVPGIGGENGLVGRIKARFLGQMGQPLQGDRSDRRPLRGLLLGSQNRVVATLNWALAYEPTPE